MLRPRRLIIFPKNSLQHVLGVCELLGDAEGGERSWGRRGVGWERARRAAWPCCVAFVSRIFPVGIVVDYIAEAAFEFPKLMKTTKNQGPARERQ